MWLLSIEMPATVSFAGKECGQPKTPRDYQAAHPEASPGVASTWMNHRLPPWSPVKQWICNNLGRQPLSAPFGGTTGY
jgi:hypothetical protein